MVVAGEASGDLHGAGLARALRRVSPDVALCGLGGPRMAGEQVDLCGTIDTTAVVGLTEALRRGPAVWRVYRALVQRLKQERPDVVVLIDFPGMNLRLAGVAHRLGIPVVYYVPPQVWAWGQRRLRTIRAHVALVLAVLPFERDLYAAAGIPVEYVGHPLLDVLEEAPDRFAARGQLGLDGHAPVIGLLPGSRQHEVDRLLPVMHGAANRIAAAEPRARFVLGLAPSLDVARIRGRLAPSPPVEVVQGGAHLVMRASDLLLVASGTATLEAALLGTPMVVCYRLSAPSEWVGRLVVRVPWISLPNLVLGRAVVPEIWRKPEVTFERLAAEALRLLWTPGALEFQREAFAELRDVLGPPGVAARAARRVLDRAASAAPAVTGL